MNMLWAISIISRWLKFRKCINILTTLINYMRKNYVLILMHTKMRFDKNLTSIIDQNLYGRTWNFLDLRRNIFQKLTLNIMFYDEKLVAFLNFLEKPIKIKNKTRKISGVIQHYPEGLHWKNNIRKRNRGFNYRKEKFKIVIICRWYDHLLRKYKRINWKT